MHRRARLGALLGALLLARTSRAAPPPPEPLRVSLSAPATCPAAPSMLERIGTHTTRVREASAEERSRLLEIAVRASAGGFVADLRLVEEQDAVTRRVPGKTCEEVLAAVALIAALAIDARAPRPEESAAPAASRPAPPARPLLFPVEALPVPPAAPRVTARLGASLELWGLGMPVVADAFWIEGASTSRLAPSLRLRFARSRSFTAEAAARAASFRVTTGALEGCVVIMEAGPLALRPCVEIAGGALDAASSAFGPTRRAVRPWFTAGALAQGRWTFLGPLALEASFGLALPLLREDFYFLPRTPIYRAPAAVLVGNVGVGTTFR